MEGEGGEIGRIGLLCSATVELLLVLPYHTGWPRLTGGVPTARHREVSLLVRVFLASCLPG